jgi:hypothetical protein
LVSDLQRRGVGFRSLHEAIDTTTPGGRLVFHIFAALAEFIRELIVEGNHEGLAAAKARGVKLGAHAAGRAGALGDLDRQAARRQPVHDLQVLLIDDRLRRMPKPCALHVLTPDRELGDQLADAGFATFRNLSIPRAQLAGFPGRMRR